MDSTKEIEKVLLNLKNDERIVQPYKRIIDEYAEAILDCLHTSVEGLCTIDDEDDDDYLSDLEKAVKLQKMKQQNAELSSEDDDED